MLGDRTIEALDQLAENFNAGDREGAVKAAREILRTQRHDYDWFIKSLKNDNLKWFVAEIFSNYPVPKRLFEPLLQAAIHETNPSMNRYLVEPCISSYGHRRVNEYLLDVVEGDNDDDIAGAVAALYWANMSLSFNADAPKFTLEHASPESREAYLALADVWGRKRTTYLRIFLQNEAVRVRQQIIPSLSLDESAYPDEMQPLVRQAIDIARAHPDDYIRHRVEVQLGNEKLLRPIPTRNFDPS